MVLRPTQEKDWLSRLSIWLGVLSSIFWLADLTAWRPSWWLAPMLLLTPYLLNQHVPATSRVIHIIALSMVAVVPPLLLGPHLFGWSFQQTTKAMAVAFYGVVLFQVLWLLGGDYATQKRRRQSDSKSALVRSQPRDRPHPDAPVGQGGDRS